MDSTLSDDIYSREMKLDEYKKKYEGDRFYKEVFEDLIYEPVVNWDANTVVDVGALAGEFSFWCHYRAKKIFAIEPQPKYFVELEQNIKDFEFDKVKPINIAISSKNGVGKLVGNNERGSESFIPDSGDVVSKTLATFMKDEGIDQIDILKIDIEGHEFSVFAADDFKDVAKDIKHIIGEHSSNQLSALLKERGYEVNLFEHGFTATQI